MMTLTNEAIGLNTVTNPEQTDKGPLTDEDYKRMGRYEFKLFTVEDYVQYKKILETIPYDWELMKFFHRQYLDECKLKHNIRKYTAGIVSFDTVSLYASDGRDLLNDMIERFEEHSRWDELRSAVSKTAFRRVTAYRIGKVKQATIAKRERRNRVTIVRSITKAEKALRAKAMKMISEKKFPGIILKAEDTNERSEDNGDQ